MKPTQAQLDGSLEIVNSYRELMCPSLSEIVAMHMADAYQSEKQDADDLEKYVAELVAQVNTEKARADLTQKRLTHLLNMVNRVTCSFRHGHGVNAIDYQDMDTLCKIEIENEIEKYRGDNNGA
jgi:hypothetical protein